MVQVVLGPALRKLPQPRSFPVLSHLVLKRFLHDEIFTRCGQQRLSECLFLSFQRDFLSLELVEGQVRLTFDLGSGALILTSSRKYNTGVWYKITLQRNKRKGTARLTPR